MGTYLTLLPLKGPSDLIDLSVVCSDRLEVPQDYRVYGQLMDMSYRRDDDGEIPEKPTIETQAIPPQLWVTIYGGSERTRTDSYNKMLTFAYAEQLKKLVLPDNSSTRMYAIKAFTDALSDDTPIILLWH